MKAGPPDRPVGGPRPTAAGRAGSRRAALGTAARSDGGPHIRAARSFRTVPIVPYAVGRTLPLPVPGRHGAARHPA